MAEKRVVKEKEKKGLDLKDIILAAVLIAAGAVLKFFVGTFINLGSMKPNFIVPMYCLSIMIIKPKFHESAFIGILAGIACQFFPGTPWLNLASELVGALVMCAFTKIPMKIGKVDLCPALGTIIATLCSGFTFIGLLYLLLYSGLSDTKPAALSVFAGMVIITAFLYAVIVCVLYVPLKLAFKKE